MSSFSAHSRRCEAWSSRISKTIDWFAQERRLQPIGGRFEEARLVEAAE